MPHARKASPSSHSPLLPLGARRDEFTPPREITRGAILQRLNVLTTFVHNTRCFFALQTRPHCRSHIPPPRMGWIPLRSLAPTYIPCKDPSSAQHLRHHTAVPRDSVYPEGDKTPRSSCSELRTSAHPSPQPESTCPAIARYTHRLSQGGHAIARQDTAPIPRETSSEELLQRTASSRPYPVLHRILITRVQNKNTYQFSCEHVVEDRAFMGRG